MTTSDESALLISALDSVRRHVLGILDGLDEEQLRRPVLPSGWSCLTLVNHLAMDDERFWFRGTVAAEPEVIADVANGVSGWELPPEVSSVEVFERYRVEAQRTDEIIEATPLDAAPAWWPDDLFGGFRMDNLREVIAHVLIETATHAGHLDAARELIDGRTWLVLD